VTAARAGGRPGASTPWAARRETLADGHSLRLVFELDSQPASYAEVLGAWRDNAAFRDWFDATLAGAPFDAFRWETPPVTKATTSRAFECVLLDAPELLRPPDSRAFAEHFGRDGEADVATFPNIGGDALLVAPRPVAPTAPYAHLAAFVRGAPEGQRHALWQAVADAMSGRLGTRPVWLSTAGAGIAWLHVRLDDRPKYYGHAPYVRAR
jgi:hypothetical protein